jgi:hypothetical protein
LELIAVAPPITAGGPGDVRLLQSAQHKISLRPQGGHNEKELNCENLMAMLQTVIVCSLLASGVSAMAESDDKRCSNRTLFGDYGSVAEGVLFNVPELPPESQFRAVTMTHFDGN